MTRAAAGAARPVPVTPRLRATELAALHAIAAEACHLLKALSNEVRLMLVCKLAEGEWSVGQLQSHVGLGQSAVSQHLALLREHGVVSTRRAGQSVRYSLASGQAAALIKTLHDQFCDRRC